MIFIKWLILFSTLVLSQQFQPNVKREFKSLAPQRTIYIDKIKIQAVIAKSKNEHQVGLMYVYELPKDSGMLFEFDEPQVLSFWMKNTKIDLSIGFFDERKKLIKIMEMKKLSNNSTYEIPKTYSSDTPAKYALEMPRGWYKSKKIKTGSKLKIP